MLAGRHPPKALRPARKRAAGRRDVGRLGGVDPAGLPGSAVRHLHLPLQVPPHRTGRIGTTDQGDLRDACALRLPARSRAAETRGLGDRTSRRPAGFTMSWASSCGTSIRRRRVKAKLREDRQEAVGRTMSGPWTSCIDQLADCAGKKLRILTIVDTHSRFCPAADPRFTYRGEDVVQTLEKVCAGAAIRRRSGSTMAASSSRGISTSGPMPTTSRSTSPGREDRTRQWRSSRRSTASSGRNA